jgi:hypothetical protein
MSGRGLGKREGEESRRKLRAELESFQNGERLVVIVSPRGSTGHSIHSDPRVKNQRQRVHITLELPWAPDACMQQLG